MTMATAPAPQTSYQMTTELVVHFISAVREVFTTMMATTVNVATPHKKSTSSPTYDVSAIIGFSGQANGSMVLSFDQQTAMKAVETLTGAPVLVDSVDFPDAVGELANMIAGGAKKHFGSVANISVPSVVIGTGHTISRLQDVPCIVIPCATAFGKFAIEVSIKASPKAA